MFRLPYKLVAIDLETTDLDPEIGSIIQIGAIYVDKSLNIIKKFNKFVLPLDSYRHPKAMAVNKISEETLQKEGIIIHKTLGLFEFFCCDAQQLAAWGSNFDIPFLKKQYEKIGRKYPFSYRYFDLKSIAIWEMARRGKPMVSGIEKFLKANNLKFNGVAHDALADIENTILLLKSFIKKENIEYCICPICKKKKAKDYFTPTTLVKGGYCCYDCYPG